MRVLIVDDDYVSRLKLKTLLAVYGDCDAVPNGKIALEMFQCAHEEMCPYELVTMDIDMPGQGGHDVVQALRQWEFEHKVFKDKKEAKILMISYLKDGKNIISSFKDGAEWYLNKPVSPQNVREALAKMGFAAKENDDRKSTPLTQA